MSYKIVIPARYGSSRLPGKPLKLLCGKPMIQWVYEAASKSRAEEVIVATDDARIIAAVEDFGGRACLTRLDHASGTDRLQEVASVQGWADDDIVVNVQGDEPLIPAAVIDQVAANLAADDRASVATLSEPIVSVGDCFDGNIVKVVSDLRGQALYFSRAPIPFDRDSYGTEPVLPDRQVSQRHIGIYAYRVRLLHQFITWPVAALEQIEKLEQLRVLANGHRIHVAEACVAVPGGVDTADDFARIQLFLEAGK